MKNYWLKRKETKNLNLYEVDDGEQHWYTASSAEEAKKMHLKPLRCPLTGVVHYGRQFDELKAHQVSPDAVLALRMEDEHDVVVKTAVEWASEGKGLVASTVY